MTQDYGFETRRKLTVLKVKESDVPDMTRLYQKRTPAERKRIETNWKRIVEQSQDDFINIVFAIRDKSGKLIGMLETEQEEKENGCFEVGIWFPNKAKQTTFLEHVRDSFLEWCETCIEQDEEGAEYEKFPIEQISLIKVLKTITKNPEEAEYFVLDKDIIFRAS